VNTLTARQKKFCDEYLISGNATDAAIKAGYSPKTAKQTGSENLAKPDLRAYIDEQLEKLHSAKIADAEEVMKYLTSVMRGEHTEQVLKLVGDGIQTVTDIEVSAKERIKAAELIGKRYALFSDKMDLGGAVPVVIMGDDQLED
jgi:phage terminase small subunit